MSHVHTEPYKATPTAVAPCPTPEPAPPVTCCELICFTRPRYFCGHLLTDEDLSLAQQYVIEKNKLHNRSLHGHGVVCGLRLTCDHHCPGHVMVGEGYAIDDCGNDLVVCEPLSVDVLKLLRDKGGLVEPHPADPCQPKDETPPCTVRQCFQLAICYTETPADYTTPFVAGCRPTLSECEPTRVREGVRFDVLLEPPARTSPFDEIGAATAKCYEVFTDGPFAQALKDNAKVLQEINAGQAKAANYKTYWDLFCKLRGLFLLYLHKHPDLYNCTMEERVQHVGFPDERASKFPQDVKDAFCGLLELVNQYVQDCVAGERVVACAEPKVASCVVLGTVEVEDGRLVRVCNTPRDWVWSFASFVQVAHAWTQAGGGELMTTPELMDTCPPSAVEPSICCPDYFFDCDDFLKGYVANPKVNYFKSTALAKAMLQMAVSFRHAFGPPRPATIPPGMFTGMTIEQAQRTAHQLNVELMVADQPAEVVPAQPSTTFETAGLAAPGDRLLLYQRGGRVTQAQKAAPATAAAVEAGPLQTLQRQVAEKNQEISALSKQVQAHTATMTELRQKLQAAEQSIRTLHQRLPEPPDEDTGEGGDDSTERRSPRRPRR